MNKLIFLTLTCLVVALVQGSPSPQFRDDPIFAAAQKGDWEEVQRLLKEQNQNFRFPDHDQLDKDVKSLRPIGNGKVFGESEYSYHTSSNVNGKTDEQSGGHRVINDNGKVREYDFEPTS